MSNREDVFNKLTPIFHEVFNDDKIILHENMTAL